MQKEYIDAGQFCSSHQVAFSVLQEMEEYDLVRLTTIEETSFISAEQLPEVEKMVRLYVDLGINREGLDAIRHLLHKMEALQQELHQLQSRLSWYEEEDPV